MNELEVLTTYISAWSWHIVGVIFLAQGITFLVFNKFVFAMGMFGVMLMCEVIAMLRKRRIEEWQEE